MSDYQTSYRRYGNQQDDRYSNERYNNPRQRGGPRDGGRRGMPLSELDPALTEISRRVIGCAIEVHKELGPGYPLAVYKQALSLELGDEEIAHEQDVAFEVFYGEDKIGEVVADFYINERFLVRMMSESRQVGGQERSELRAQLRAADLELGLIINFGERRLKDGLVRVLNPDKLNAQTEGGSEGDAEYDEEDEQE